MTKGSLPRVPHSETNLLLDAMKQLMGLIDEARLYSGGVDEDFNPEKLEALIVERTCEFFNVEVCSLFLLGQIGTMEKEVLFRSAQGKSLNWDYQVILDREGGGIVETCIQEKRPILVEDFSEGQSFNSKIDAPLGADGKPFDVRGTLCVPLLINDRTFGALQVINKIGASFDDIDQNLLTLEASSLASMLYNTRLIQKLQIAYAELETKRWQLVHSQNTLRALFDSIPASIYIINRK
jgi:GAF domain-containing protein